MKFIDIVEMQDMDAPLIRVDERQWRMITNIQKLNDGKVSRFNGKIIAGNQRFSGKEGESLIKNDSAYWQIIVAPGEERFVKVREFER